MHASPDYQDPANPQGDGDAAIIERVLAGDIDQFARLVERYQAALYRHAVAMVLDHDAAADMVQDAFIRVFTNLGYCRDRRRFRGWLFQTLRNRCLDYLKEARRRNIRLDDIEPLPDPADGPNEIVERRRIRSHVKEALAQLPEAQREAFVMHYVEEMPYEAMARLLGTRVSALKMRVMRAREALSAGLRRREVTKPSAARLYVRRR